MKETAEFMSLDLKCDTYILLHDDTKRMRRCFLPCACSGPVLFAVYIYIMDEAK